MIEREKLQHLIENIGIPKLCLILLLGISLIIVSIPSGKTKKNTQSSETTAKEDSTDLYVKKQERRLVNALKHQTADNTIIKISKVERNSYHGIKRDRKNSN